MALSDKRQGLVNLIIETHCSELSSRQTAELAHLCHSLGRRGQWKSAMNRKHGEDMTEQGKFIVRTYLENYKEEGKTIEANDISILMAGIAHRFATETNERALKVQEFSGSSTEMVSLLHDIEDRLRQDMVIAMKSAELNSGAQRQAISQVVEEQIRQERRVLSRMYFVSEGRTSRGIEYDEVAETEGLTTAEVLHICDRLNAKGLIEIIASKLARITVEGMTKIENENETRDSSVQYRKTTAQLDFSFVSDDEIKAIIERDYGELQELEPERAPKSVLVLCGSIIEGLLLDAIVTTGHWTSKEGSGRFLKDMIYQAKTAGIIQHDNLSDVLRVFRNLVHPAREIRDKLVFDESHAKHARAAVEVIISEVRKWYYGRTP